MTRASPETTCTNAFVCRAPGDTTITLSGSRPTAGTPGLCAPASWTARSGTTPASRMMLCNGSFMSSLLRIGGSSHEHLFRVDESDRSRDTVRTEQDVRLDARVGLDGVHDGKGRHRDANPHHAIGGAWRY